MQDQITIAASLKSLESAMQWVGSRCIGAGLSSGEARKVELAMEEALVNIIRYAYKKEDKGSISLFSRLLEGNRIEFMIKDNGLPFNPLVAPFKDHADESLEERKEGGLGIFLMREMVDEVHYERLTPFNILTLIKTLQ